MDILLTLCDKDHNGNVPMYDFLGIEKGKDLHLANEPMQLFYHWISKKKFKESVFVCFENFRGLDFDELRDEQRSFLISHNWEDITTFCEEKMLHDADYTVNFAVFEFDNYQDAFQYCMDLKEGF